MNQKPSTRIEELVKNRSGVANYLTAIIQYLDEQHEKNKCEHEIEYTNSSEHAPLSTLEEIAQDDKWGKGKAMFSCL